MPGLPRLAGGKSAAFQRTGSPAIRPITGRPSLPPTSSTPWGVGPSLRLAWSAVALTPWGLPSSAIARCVEGRDLPLPRRESRPADVPWCRWHAHPLTVLVQARQPPWACEPITRPRRPFACAAPSSTPSRPRLPCGSGPPDFSRSFTPPDYSGRMCEMRESEQDHSGPSGPLADRDFSSHHAGAFHRHVGHVPGCQPIRQRPQLARRGPEGADPLPVRCDRAGHHRLLVDVQPAAPLMDHLQRAPPLPSGRSAGGPLQQRLSPACSQRSWGDNVWCLQAAGSVCGSGSRHQIDTSSGADPRDPIFILRGAGVNRHEGFQSTH